jgi:hypothetical protein
VDTWTARVQLSILGLITLLQLLGLRHRRYTDPSAWQNAATCPLSSRRLCILAAKLWASVGPCRPKRAIALTSTGSGRLLELVSVPELVC